MLNRLSKSKKVAPRANQKSAPAPAKTEKSSNAKLIAQLRDVRVEVSLEAAAALGSVKDVAVVNALAAAVVNADLYFDPLVRAAAAESLAKIGDRRAVEALIVGVRDPIAETSQAAIRALVVLADPQAVEPLLAVVRNREGYFAADTRHAAVQALTRFSVPAGNN